MGGASAVLQMDQQCFSKKNKCSAALGGNAEHFLWTFLGGGEEWGRILSPRFCDQSPSKPSQKEKEKKKPSSQATKNSTFTNTYDFIPYTIKTRPLMTKVPIHLVVRLGLSQADHFKSIKNP